MDQYECDNCGACCKHLLVEVYDLDLLREPKLATADIGDWARGMAQAQLMAELDDGKCLLIAAPGQTCQFLGDDNKCTIYPTRPNVCVAMEAGDEQCQESRRKDGLPPLEPVKNTESNQDANQDGIV